MQPRTGGHSRDSPGSGFDPAELRHLPVPDLRIEVGQLRNRDRRRPLGRPLLRRHLSRQPFVRGATGRRYRRPPGKHRAAADQRDSGSRRGTHLPAGHLGQQPHVLIRVAAWRRRDRRRELRHLHGPGSRRDAAALMPCDREQCRRRRERDQQPGQRSSRSPGQLPAAIGDRDSRGRAAAHLQQGDLDGRADADPDGPVAARRHRDRRGERGYLHRAGRRRDPRSLLPSHRRKRRRQRGARRAARSMCRRWPRRTPRYRR